MADELMENKIWNAYIDKYGKEPYPMGQLHNFSKGPNNPYDNYKLSFQNVAKIYRRNKGKGKVPIPNTGENEKKDDKGKVPIPNTGENEKKDNKPLTSTTDDIHELKKQNEELRKQLDKLLAQVGPKTEEKKEESQPKSKTTLHFRNDYALWSELDKHIRDGDEDFVRQLLNEGIVEVNSVRKGQNQSMLHIASNHGQYRIAQMLLNLGADVNYKSRFPARDALKFAQMQGHYHVEKLLMLSKMDASASDQINDIATKLNTQKGIMHYLYESAAKRKDGDVIFDGIVDIMSDIINQRQAFSDDILNVALDYSIRKSMKPQRNDGEGRDVEKKDNKDVNETIDRDIVISTELWQCIYKTCTQIITRKKANKLEWYWLKTYLLSSTIWLRQFKDKRNNNELSPLYFELLDIVGAQAITQIDVHLKEPFKKIAEDNASDWKALCAFDVDIRHKGEIRQDAIDNGHKAQYTRDVLGKKCVSIDPFNAFNHYDTRQYLSSLVLTAQMVNTQFQKDIVKIFEVSMKTLVGKFDVVYKEGPVKLLSRCQAKAETDYKIEKFPTSAHVLDINRCSLIFADISSMLKGLKLFAESVRNHEANEICITEIIRIKNGWAQYNHNNPAYSDIKFNVVIKGEYHSIVGEVQFLLRSMMQFKSIAHPLYSIQRKKEFILSMSDILPFLTDIPKTLNVNATLGNVNGICDAMVTQHLDVEAIVSKQYKNNIFDILCLSGHVRALKFLMDIMPDTLIIDRLRNKDDFGRAFAAEVVGTGKRQVIELIFKHKPFRDSIDEDAWLAIMNSMLRHCDCQTANIMLTIDNIYKRIPTKAWDQAIGSSLSFGKSEYFVLLTNLCDENIVKEVIISSNHLETAVATNWDEHRLELTKCIIHFADYKDTVKEQNIADALYTSVAKNDIDVFKLICNELITARNDKMEKYLLMPHSKKKQNTLQSGCKEGNRSDFIDILLSNVSDANIARYVNYKGGECTAIAFAARKGESQIIDKLLKVPGIDVFGENEEKTSSSIIEALKRGNILIAEKLYDKLSEAQKQYKYESKLLWETVVSTTKRSDVKALRFVIDKLVNNSTEILAKCDNKMGSLITIATDSDHDVVDKVKYLCSVSPQNKIADLINYQTEKGKNAVLNAVNKSKLDLLSYFHTIPGVNFELTDRNKRSAFANAAHSLKFEIAELLFARHKSEKDKLDALRAVDSSGNCVFVDVSKDGKRKLGLTPIVLRNIDFTLIDLKVLNDVDEFGENAMSFAARIGVMDIVERLLSIKGIVITPDSILKAITVDVYSMGELAIGAKLYQCLSGDGQKSFTFKNEDIFNIFRGLCHARVNEQKSIEIMKFMVDKLIVNSTDLSDILLMRGAANNLYSDNILLSSMRHNKVEVCKYIMSLISNDAVIDEINYQDEWGNNVLEYGANKGSLLLFEHIAKTYKDVNMAQINSKTGDTSFHVAAKNGYCDICKVILSQFANNEQKLSLISLKNNKNETAVMVAKNKSVQIEIQKWKTEFSE